MCPFHSEYLSLQLFVPSRWLWAVKYFQDLVSCIVQMIYHAWKNLGIRFLQTRSVEDKILQSENLPSELEGQAVLTLIYDQIQMTLTITKFTSWALNNASQLCGAVGIRLNAKPNRKLYKDYFLRLFCLSHLSCSSIKNLLLNKNIWNIILAR